MKLHYPWHYTIYNWYSTAEAGQTRSEALIAHLIDLIGSEISHDFWKRIGSRSGADQEQIHSDFLSSERSHDIGRGSAPNLLPIPSLFRASNWLRQVTWDPLPKFLTFDSISTSDIIEIGRINRPYKRPQIPIISDHLQ